MAGLLSKGFKIAENFLEDVDRKVETRVGVPQATGATGESVRAPSRSSSPSTVAPDRAAAFERQIAELHVQLAEQRETIATLKSQLTECDATAMDGLRQAAESARAALEQAHQDLDRERTSHATASEQLRSEVTAAEASVEAARNDLAVAQASARRREMQLSSDIEALHRQLQHAALREQVPDDIIPPLSAQRSDTVVRELEAALQSERRRYQEAATELTHVRVQMSDAQRSYTDLQRQTASLEEQLNQARKQLLVHQASFSHEATKASEERIVALMRSLTAAEAEKDRLIAEGRAAKHLAAELRTQLSESRAKYEDVETRASMMEAGGATATKVPSRRQKAQETPLSLVDSAFVLIGRLFARDPRARFVVMIYLAAIHAWCFWLLTFHSHAISHGQHVGK